MSKIKSLPGQRLCSSLPPDRVPWETSDAIPRNGHRKVAPQPRALKALELALHIHTAGYNIYLSGESNLGRTYMLREFLEPRIRKAQTPPDLLYVNNFDDPDRPMLLSVPAGQGKKLRSVLSQALADIRKELPVRLDNEKYVKKRSELQDRFQAVRSGLIKQMDKTAGKEGFNLDMDEQGSLTLYPLVEGKRLSEDEYEHLDPTLRQGLKQKGDTLLRAMSGMVRKLNSAEQSFRSDERTLEQEVIGSVLSAVLSPAVERILKNCAGPDGELDSTLKKYFEALRQDILDHPEGFLPRETQPAQALSAALSGDAQHPETDTYLYDVNVFVDNSGNKGAPLIIEDHPTTANLLGCVERESEMGALVTDFTLIRAGSLHRANGGFLVLHVEDLLQHPTAWEGLLRALRANAARIEDTGENPDTAIRTKGIVPDPVPLTLKVLLIGDDELYETLLLNDERFPKLFRIKAHMAEVTERTANVRAYLIHVAVMITEDDLPPFDRTALAWLIDLGSHLCEDQRRLSLRFPLLREIMIEAAALARLRGASMVDAAVLEEAYAARTYRANLVEEAFMEDYDREMIKVRTSGSAVGQVNGLSVTWHGDFEFGLPHRISCSVGVGHEGIMDLEREAELGGPIHTKAMMILKSYLTDQFARKKPLVLSASLYFDQSYAGIEGDSASGAELAALLSALAEVPVRLDLAFTGAVNHTGQILAVGGVTSKIEGFYKVCARHGLTGTQGVIIPHDNADHLMLAPDVLAAVDQGRFAIYTVRSIEEALTLLTGLPVGRRLKNGGFTRNSLYDKVDRRLEQLGDYAQNAFRRPRRS